MTPARRPPGASLGLSVSVAGRAGPGSVVGVAGDGGVSARLDSPQMREGLEEPGRP